MPLPRPRARAGFERNGDMDRARQVYDEMQAAGAARGPLGEAPPHHAAQQAAPGDAHPACCHAAPSPRFPGFLDAFGRKLQQVRAATTLFHRSPPPGCRCSRELGFGKPSGR